MTAEYRNMEYVLLQKLSYGNLAALMDLTAQDTGMRVERTNNMGILYFTLQRADGSPIAELWLYRPQGVGYGDNIGSESQDVYSIYATPAPETLVPPELMKKMEPGKERGRAVLESRKQTAEEIQRYMSALLGHCEAVRI
jgi:hypothetical protein